MSAADASRAADIDARSTAGLLICRECRGEYAVGKQLSPYCSPKCKERLRAVRAGRMLFQGRDGIDHERLTWALVVARPSTGVPLKELRRLIGQPSPITDPPGTECESCGDTGWVLATLQDRPHAPVPYCLACYRRRLTEHLMIGQTGDPATPRAVLARIFAPRPMDKRDDETRSDYRKLIYEELKHQHLIVGTQADLRAWADAVADRLATGREQGLDADDVLESALADALEDLGLPADRRKRLFRRIVALPDEYTQSPETLTDLASSDVPVPNE
jgi:hypothetical protein